VNFLEGLTCRHPVDERKVNDLIVLPLILVPRAMTPHWLSEVRDEKFVGSVGTDWLIECSLSTTGSQADKFTCELVVITCNEPAPLTTDQSHCAPNERWTRARTSKCNFSKVKLSVQRCFNNFTKWQIFTLSNI